MSFEAVFEQDQGRAIASMRGTVVGRSQDGESLVANMTSPQALLGVELPIEALRLTKGYANPGARTRITRLACPDLPVGVGDQVVAAVAVTTEETDNMVRNPAANRDYWAPPYIREVVITDGRAVKWGPVPKQ